MQVFFGFAPNLRCTNPMIVIFNGGAVGVAFIAAILISPILLLDYLNVLETDNAVFLACWALFAASLIGAKMNLRARLFVVFPTWVLTLPIALVATVHHADKIFSLAKGVLMILGILIGALVLLITIGSLYYERKRFKALLVQVIELPGREEGDVKYWRAIRSLFFFPRFGKWTGLVYDHNLRVLDMLRENNVELEHADAFAADLSRVRDGFQAGIVAAPDKKIRQHFQLAMLAKTNSAKPQEVGPGAVPESAGTSS